MNGYKVTPLHNFVARVKVVIKDEEEEQEQGKLFTVRNTRRWTQWQLI
jgi:hypothetical protein